jgi:TPP-dependent pyruvate/acetoin dehydrogenase alpha subunit
VDVRARSLQTLTTRLTTQGLADASMFQRIDADVKSEIDTGVQYALGAPYPEASQVDEDVYA